jgi:hypothetical protein
LNAFATSRGGVPLTLAFPAICHASGKLTASTLTLPRQTGPDVKFGNHLEEGHDKEDAEAVHGGAAAVARLNEPGETLSSVAQALGVAATQVKT